MDKLLTLIETAQPVTRRQAVTLGAVALAAPAVLRAGPALAADDIIRIGYVNARTGPLAGFGEADQFTLDQIGKLLANGLSSGGKTYKVEIIAKDSQSNPN